MVEERRDGGHWLIAQGLRTVIGDVDEGGLLKVVGDGGGQCAEEREHKEGRE